MSKRAAKQSIKASAMDTKQAVKVDLDSELVKICSQENEEQGIMPVDQYVSGASGYTVVK